MEKYPVPNVPILVFKLCKNSRRTQTDINDHKGLLHFHLSTPFVKFGDVIRFQTCNNISKNAIKSENLP